MLSDQINKKYDIVVCCVSVLFLKHALFDTANLVLCATLDRSLTQQYMIETLLEICE